MKTTETIIIGAGQAGLAMSRSLSDQGIDHVVLERGRIAERWRSERWDSLRLLSPNWMTRLPGWSYDGPDPDGFMFADEAVDYFVRYAGSFAAPVHEETQVESLSFDGDRYRIVTSAGVWRAANVVIATGWCDRPAVPAMARNLASGIHQVMPNRYRNPAGLPHGGVLVVGASGTGVQLADELHAAGREVMLAAGRHTRLPRRYRGMDIYWWLERLGRFNATIDQRPDPIRARREPSAQLVGCDDGRSLDFASLRDVGVQVTGRVTAIDGYHVSLADDLPATFASADARMRRLLVDIDRHIDDNGLAGEVLEPEILPPLRLSPAPRRLDLRARRISTVVWATGYRRSYPWLHLPVLDTAGEIAQRAGLTTMPGLFVLGQRFQRFRNSDFIDGVGRDARFIADRIVRVCGVHR